MFDIQLAQAAALLVEIAGPESVHIEMAARGPKKYYEVHRRLSEQDACAHLAGRSTRGATLRHPGGVTRALCYDADTFDDWLRLLEAAWMLAEQGYRPLLEESPAGRGGHLWIIFTGLVRTSWAHRHAMLFAPTLKHITERWPGQSGQKVRLPGGLYVRPGVRAWCRLYDAQGRLLSADGQGAARVLLAMQTPAEFVPAYPDDQSSGGTGKFVALSNVQDEQPNAVPLRDAHSKPGPDQRWRQKYGRFMWFQFTPVQLATWYNQRTQVEEILPAEKNGMGLASWRGEPPPAWVQPFMTAAGWQRYHALRAEAAHAATYRGVAGFHTPSE